MRRWEHPKRYPLDLYLGPTTPLGLAGFGLVITIVTMLMMTNDKACPSMRALTSFESSFSRISQRPEEASNP